MTGFRCGVQGYIVEVLCGVKHTKNSLDVVSVVRAAERVPGVGGVEPAYLDSYEFLESGQQVIVETEQNEDNI